MKEQGQQSKKARGGLGAWAYPVSLAVAGGGSALAVSLGALPLVVLAVLTALAVVWVICLERAIPYRGAWRHSHGDEPTDAMHAVVNLGVPAVYRGAVDGLGLVAASSMSGVCLWPSHWPLVAQAALAFVVADLGAYLGHRLVHRVPLLWRFHEVHHSAPRLYWLNAQRFHPLDLTLIHAASISPLLFLGVGESVLVVVAAVSTVNALFQHSNARIEAGWLNWVFSTAELHRWHHATDPDHRHWNYGAGLIVWDLIFGTRRLPADVEPPTDLSIPAYPRRFWRLLLRPFKSPSRGE